MIPELRRKINDSNIGQKINHTIPGILVEGASREISDAIGKAADTALIILAAALKAEGCPRNIEGHALTELLPVVLTVAASSAIRETCEDARTHYSHTSPLYNKTTLGGDEVMERVPMKHALIQRLYRNEPEKAAVLIISDALDNYLG